MVQAGASGSNLRWPAGRHNVLRRGRERLRECKWELQRARRRTAYLSFSFRSVGTGREFRRSRAGRRWGLSDARNLVDHLSREPLNHDRLVRERARERGVVGRDAGVRDAGNPGSCATPR